MKNKILRTLALIMICCVSFLCVGCMGPNRDDDDYDEGDDIGEEAVIDMYGTKVLYRPDSYDFNFGSGGTAGGNDNDYYGQYAWQILYELYLLYGVTDPSRFTDEDSIIMNNLGNDNIYLYDSIRYQVNTKYNVTNVRQNGATKADNYVVVAANPNARWKWTFDYDVSDIPALLSSHTNNQVYFKTPIELTLSDYDDYYSEFSSDYLTTFLGTDSSTSYSLYSQYVKALEYVVYSYALDLEPQQIDVYMTSVAPYYEVRIGGRDVDSALENIKALFKKLGSYVGLMQRQIVKISNWIKTNVIGLDNPMIESDMFYEYDNVTAVLDANGNIASFEAGVGNAKPLGRNYSQTVDNVVAAVCKYVTIGSDNGGDVTVDDRFLASEIVEYAGSSFIIGGDNDFKLTRPGLSPAILPYEYQSAVIMLKEKTYISDVWVALKYDADLDGTKEGEYNFDKYLDIIVELNYYNHAANKMVTIGSQKTRVYDGPYVFGADDSDCPGLPDNHGLVLFGIERTPELKDLLVDTSVDEYVLPVEPFSVDIGNGILKTDVGQAGYQGRPNLSVNPLLLLGNTDVRKYYSIIEPTDSELGENETYVTGRLNQNMFSGADGSDYLEITYKVLKRPGDTSTNYKFFTGLAGILTSDGE